MTQEITKTALEWMEIADRLVDEDDDLVEKIGTKVEPVWDEKGDREAVALRLWESELKAIADITEAHL